MKIVSRIWERERIPLLYPFMQKGVRIRVRLGASVQSVLCEQFALDPEYVARRIQTAFLDGNPVDDFGSARVAEGSVLALSGALPGLAGAMLRRQGIFSPMRAALSHRDRGRGEEKSDGFIALRIFNILLSELTPVFLERGIYLEKSEWDALMRGLSSQDREDIERRAIRGGDEADEEVPADLIQIRLDE